MPKQRAARPPQPQHPDDPEADSQPLTEFGWNDEIVGMGFFPDEVLLPSDWTWGS